MRNSLLLILSLFLCINANAQINAERCSKVHAVIDALKNNHFDPVNLDSTSRAQIIELYVKDVDENFKAFTTDDLFELKQKAKKGLCEAFELALEKERKASKIRDSLYRKLLNAPLVFVKGETFLYNRFTQEKQRPNAKGYLPYIGKRLKSNVLMEMYRELSKDSLANDGKMNAALELKVRTKFLKELDEKNKKSATFETRRFTSFLNAIAQRYDPHSAYFPITEKKQFDALLSKEIKMFGIEFEEDLNNQVVVAKIVPGSAAWISNQLFAGDIIEGVKTEKGEVIYSENKGVESFLEVLQNQTGDILTFLVIDKNKIKKEVRLEKATVENDENVIKGYVLVKGKKKIGYIPLPSFYMDMENEQFLGCANDVAKEIILLKKDSIEGLIIDVRNNGGGSLKEAIELSGLFIDMGAVSIYKDKTGKNSLLKDPSRGTVFDGPLLIMVNNNSASASEFFAGSMQDYNRGVIFGTSTFGKASSQSFFPLDTIHFETSDYLKITNGKFYHVSKRSNQEIGIQPDIVMKDRYADIDGVSERDFPYHFKNDSVVKNLVIQQLPALGISTLNQHAQARLESNPTYLKERELAKKIKEKYTMDFALPLTPKEFYVYWKKLEDESEKLQERDTTFSTDLKVEDHAFRNKMKLYDVKESTHVEDVKEDIRLDLQINEAMNVVLEMVNN